jgi:hypothetical protein
MDQRSYQQPRPTNETADQIAIFGFGAMPGVTNWANRASPQALPLRAQMTIPEVEEV